MTDNDIRNHIISYNPDLAGKLDDFTAMATTEYVANNHAKSMAQYLLC
jgi:hypothetical protein